MDIKQRLKIISADPEHAKLYEYTDATHPHMEEAYREACKSGCGSRQTGAIIVRNARIIGRGHNSGERMPNPCPRVLRDLPSGVLYELCEECTDRNHAEAVAIYDARSQNSETEGAELYLFGHWWVCISCWEKILAARIKEIFIVHNARQLFSARGLLKGKSWYTTPAGHPNPPQHIGHNCEKM